jgi:hypothetical protein
MSLTAILVLALELVASDADAAFKDLATLPTDEQPHYFYLTTSVVAPEHRDALHNVLRFTVPSLSRKSYLPEQLPVPVEGTSLLRLDTRGLGWSQSWQQVVAEQYVPNYRPDLLGVKNQYGHAAAPIVVSGLWAAVVLTDPVLSGDAQYKLLYGTPPKTATEFRKLWLVNEDGGLAFGRLERGSGVALERKRLMENKATANRAYFWQTYDSRVVAGETDPLENLTARPPKHDASELIAGIVKYSGDERGTLQAYFLADAQDKRQEKAPADIVVDDTGLHPGVEIHNTSSCISCHTEGLRHPNIDGYKAYILSGARVYAYDKATQQDIDRYFHSPVANEIERNNADYAAGVKMCNGLGPADNALLYRMVAGLYYQDVDLAQAARELPMPIEARELQLALGDYSRTKQLSAALSELASGGKLSRNQWLANIPLAFKAVYAWHATTK